MISRRSAVFGLLSVVAVPRGANAEQSAQAFLAGIYSAYKGKDSKGAKIGTRREIDRYFAPALARLIDADAKAAARRREVGVLGGDPFIDAQDWEIDAFEIGVKDTAPGKAVGTVKFKNIGEPQTVALDLIKLKNGWRIEEIRGTSTKSLRALFKKR